MMSRYLGVFIFFLFVCFTGFCQTELTLSEQQVFKSKVLKRAENTKSIVSDFKQIKHIDVLNNDIEAEGSMVFKSPNLIRWEYIKPYKTTAIFKNDKLYVNNEGKKDAIDLTSNKLFKSFNALIANSIKGNMFDDAQFGIKYFKLVSGYKAIFEPKDKRLKNYVGSFELLFAPDTGDVNEVKLIEPNSDYTKIIFINKRLNTEVGNAAFKN